MYPCSAKFRTLTPNISPELNQSISTYCDNCKNRTFLWLTTNYLQHSAKILKGDKYMPANFDPKAGAIILNTKFSKICSLAQEHCTYELVEEGYQSDMISVSHSWPHAPSGYQWEWGCVCPWRADMSGTECIRPSGLALQATEELHERACTAGGGSAQVSNIHLHNMYMI